MKIFCFAEGALLTRGGVGFVGVPSIAKSLADRGHQVVLIIGGNCIPGAERFVQPSISSALQQKSGAGTFGIVTYRAHGEWAFAPSMIRGVAQYIRDAHFISLHSLYSFPVLAGYLLARHYHKPYGLWPHGVLAPFQRNASAWKKVPYWVIAKRILNEASILFYSATGECEEVRSLQLKPRSAIIPHGFDAQEYMQLPARGLFLLKYLDGHAGPLVLFLSRINAKKGLDILIKAFAIVAMKIPEARLAIVGLADPPSLEAKLKTMLRESGIEEKVVMPGFLRGKEKQSAFADADVFVLPSHAENFGFAVFEAMASRVPVVISSSLNYASQIRNYGAGIVVNLDPSLFASAIIELLRDCSLRRKMGANGLRLAKTYSWARCGEMFEESIRSVQKRDGPEPN